jgi:hypothetical protein
MTLLAHAAGTDESLSLILLFAGIWVGWIGWSRLREKGFERLPRWAGWTLVTCAVALVIAATFVPRMLVGAETTPAVDGSRPRLPATRALTPPRGGLHTDATS